ncbi:MAG: HEAT repeat domain-containing protein [Planctomycetes bacterium]|nr:HEAT repeat domain-containing protein [Planctomycetota bacterium]
MRCAAVRSCCCMLLASVGCSQPTSHWAEQAKSDDPAQRVHAIHMLQEKHTEAATVVPVLIESLKDKNMYVRRDAARALGKFGAEAKDAVGPLVDRLRDDEPSVRKAAGQSLKQIDPNAATKAGVP